MKSRLLSKDYTQSPGVGMYKTEGYKGLGSSGTSPAFAGRREDRDFTQAPGVGTYKTESYKALGSDGSAPTFKGRHEEKDYTQSPGPAQYLIRSKSSGPSFTFGRRYRIKMYY